MDATLIVKDEVVTLYIVVWPFFASKPMVNPVPASLMMSTDSVTCALLPKAVP